MNLDKMLLHINKAIENLSEEDTEIITNMRGMGAKSADNLTFWLDSPAIWLETLRNEIIAEIQTSEARKTGKSSVLSTVKKLQKDAFKRMGYKSVMKYANYDAKTGKYTLCNAFVALRTEIPDGLEIKPERLIGEPVDLTHMFETDYPKTQELPPIGKYVAWHKAEKLKHGNDENVRCCLNEELLTFNAEFLEWAMKITGSTQLRYIDFKHQAYMCGNGYEVVIQPTQPKRDSEGNYCGEVTNFDI